MAAMIHNRTRRQSKWLVEGQACGHRWVQESRLAPGQFLHRMEVDPGRMTYVCVECSKELERHRVKRAIIVIREYRPGDGSKYTDKSHVHSISSHTDSEEETPITTTRCCAHEGCTTILSRWNQENVCYLHQGDDGRLLIEDASTFA